MDIVRLADHLDMLLGRRLGELTTQLRLIELERGTKRLREFGESLEHLGTVRAEDFDGSTIEVVLDAV